MKKVLSLMMICILVLTSYIKAYAATPTAKEEVVYGLLAHDGSVRNLYVVNIFEGGLITDFGNYEKVKNLTDTEPIFVSGDMITVNTDSDKFYYQGYLVSKELPWDINIRYYLDDTEIAGGDLAGKNGRLKISISVNQNPNSDSIFFENYGLQISLVLDSSLCTDIIADNATLAEAGGKKQISFTVLPGKSFEGSVTADVKNFEMESISINAVRLNFDMDIDTDDYVDRFSDLINGLEELDNGAGKLLCGIKELADGMDEYRNGVKAFSEGISNIPTGAGNILVGAEALSMGLSELAKENENIMNGAYTLQKAAFDAVNAQLSGMGLNLPLLTPENYDSVLSGIPDLYMIKMQLDGVTQFINGLKDYTGAVTQLSKGAGDLSEGIKLFKESASEIASAAEALYDGAEKINAGIKELYEGMNNFKKGTGEFKSKTSGMEDKLKQEIDKLIKDLFGSEKQVKSFVSEKNTKIISLQFVLRTDSIKITNVSAAEIAESVKLTFWQKLLKLFGFYKN
ncbi:hypothetical protein DFR55_10139 [Herbinix hemicellulosilytica]|uniref:Secreted protein n=1 Tax=Herbinix hemicellulosilytica TaxID=1564487 RepID=A0A0H5SFL3_HERHM|nr:hypothetical protein [Herbinix hemicellulosilytica]RBP60580.1 hypothetical protein DFR55_10139 [Herbinix hemicellulosilytica]CRZ34267.1 hypothetical protein HHT355_1065 [Herbinix hemicellulosilytica]